MISTAPMGGNGGIPADFSSYPYIGQRRIKTSADSAMVEAALNDTLFTVSGSYAVLDGESLSFNLYPAADLIVRAVSVDGDYQILAYNDHATGSADGIFTAISVNLIADDISPTQGQLFYNSTAAGSVFFSGSGSIMPAAVAGYGDKPSFFVPNNTGATKTIRITITFEEIGPREPSFGLTPSTLLQPTTEMSNYG